MDNSTIRCRQGHVRSVVRRRRACHPIALCLALGLGCRAQEAPRLEDDGIDVDEDMDAASIVPPDDSRPGQLRAALLTMLSQGSPEAEMRAVARQRREVLREGWSAGESYGPGAFFDISERERFPPSVAALIEHQGVIEGTVRQVAIDTPDHEGGDPSSGVQWAIDGDGHVLEIVRPDIDSIAELVGERVRGVGWRLDDFVMPDVLEVQPSATPQLSGERDVLAIITELSPEEPHDYWSEAEIRDVFEERADSTRDIYLDMSDGLLELDLGDVVGPYSLYDSAEGQAPSCDIYAWGNRVVQAAAADGVDVEAYEQIMILLPPDQTETACDWTGIAVMRGTRLWSRSQTRWTFAHELGHNYGMMHAGRIICDGEPLRASQETLKQECQIRPRNDREDFMGYSPYVRLNVVHQHDLGWLAPGEIVGLEASGTYTLTPLYGDHSGDRALRYWHPGLESDLYVSYRRPDAPFDDDLLSNGQGVEMHLDMEIGSGVNRADTAAVTIEDLDETEHDDRFHLVDGGVFWDREGGLRVEQISHDALHSVVEVSNVPHTDVHDGLGAEQVEDVAVGVAPDGSQYALALYHEPTGHSANPLTEGVFGRQHTRLVTRVSRDGEPLEARVLATPPAPTSIISRSEVHAAATYDPDREMFVVVSTQQIEGELNPHGPGTTHTFLRVSEIDPDSGEVYERGHLDLGPYWLAQGQTNPMSFTEPVVDVVHTAQGLVMIMGYGTNNLGEMGQALVLGRWSAPDDGAYAIEAIDDLDLRPLPATARAKWPTLSVGEVDGQPVVAIAYTHKPSPSQSNRVAMLGYLPGDDMVFAPGVAAVPVEDSESITPQRIDEVLDGSYAFSPDIAFDPLTERFGVVYTTVAPGYDWEIMQRWLSLAPMSPSAITDAAHVAAPAWAQWSHSARVAVGSDGTRAVVFEADRDEFFDGQASARVEFFDADGTSQGGATLPDSVATMGTVALSGSAALDRFYVLRTDPGRLTLETVRLGWSTD